MLEVVFKTFFYSLTVVLMELFPSLTILLAVCGVKINMGPYREVCYNFSWLEFLNYFQSRWGIFSQVPVFIAIRCLIGQHTFLSTFIMCILLSIFKIVQGICPLFFFIFKSCKTTLKSIDSLINLKLSTVSKDPVTFHLYVLGVQLIVAHVFY